MVKSKTLFLDRDGVLNRAVLRCSKASSPRTQKELVFSEDLFALTEPSIIGDWNLVILSNQPDLARGMIDQEPVKYINRSILEQIPLNASYICPHTASDNCCCRKPKTSLVDRFKKNYPQEIEKLVLVGDRDTDRKCAEQADVEFILRKREYNVPCMAYVDYSAESLFDLSPLLDRLFPV